MGERRYVWTSSDQDLGAPKNSGLMLQKKEGEADKIQEKERQQLLAGLGIWKLEFKSDLGRRAKDRKLISGGRIRPGLLSGILNRPRKAR